jgi:hypothetical protein
MLEHDLKIRAYEALIEKQDDEYKELNLEKKMEFEVWTDLIAYLAKDKDNLRSILLEALTPERQEYVKGFVEDLIG